MFQKSLIYITLASCLLSGFITEKAQATEGFNQINKKMAELNIDPQKELKVDNFTTQFNEEVMGYIARSKNKAHTERVNELVKLTQKYFLFDEITYKSVDKYAEDFSPEQKRRFKSLFEKEFAESMIESLKNTSGSFSEDYTVTEASIKKSKGNLYIAASGISIGLTEVELEYYIVESKSRPNVFKIVDIQIDDFSFLRGAHYNLGIEYATSADREISSKIDSWLEDPFNRGY